jgi:hypothetical protein
LGSPTRERRCSTAPAFHGSPPPRTVASDRYSVGSLSLCARSSSRQMARALASGEGPRMGGARLEVATSFVASTALPDNPAALTRKRYRVSAPRHSRSSSRAGVRRRGSAARKGRSAGGAGDAAAFKLRPELALGCRGVEARSPEGRRPRPAPVQVLLAHLPDRGPPADLGRAPDRLLG